MLTKIKKKNTEYMTTLSVFSKLHTIMYISMIVKNIDFQMIQYTYYIVLPVIYRKKYLFRLVSYPSTN